MLMLLKISAGMSSLLSILMIGYNIKIFRKNIRERSDIYLDFCIFSIILIICFYVLK